MTGAVSPASPPEPGGNVTATASHPWRLSAIVVSVLLLTFGLVRIAAGGGSGPAATGSGAAGRTAEVGTAAGPGAESPAASARTSTRWVSVSVATLWVRPTYHRPIDWPAISSPANPRRWVASMSYAQKMWLVGKLETQALYGTKVTVLARDGTWAKVVVPSQPTNRDARGYPGWVPSRQLTATAPAAARVTAVVRSPTTWLWSGWNSAGVTGSKVMEISYGTRLPVVSATSTYVRVSLIGGRTVALRRSAVILHTEGTAWGATRARLVSEAKKFRGLQYLWAGTSGFGYDCSGFTYSLYRAYGVTLSRDADQQAVHGKPVARSALRPADLVFYRGAGGSIGHVGMYIGSGKIIDAPQTGMGIRIEPVSAHSSYAGARRYLSR